MNKADNINGNTVASPSKKQMPGLYQSKDMSKLKSADFPGITDEGDNIVNSDEQSRVTKAADPVAGTPGKSEKEQAYYKKDLPDVSAADAEKEDIKETYRDEKINVEPVLDNDGNEIGGEG